MFKVLHILLSSMPRSPITDSSDSTSSRAAMCIFIHNFNRLEELDLHCRSVFTHQRAKGSPGDNSAARMGA